MLSRDRKAVHVTVSRGTPLRIYLIRHGETAWSLSGQYTGRANIPLTTHGEDEARELGLRIQNTPFTHVFTSPLTRAQQTCALVGLNGTPEIVPDLMEWDNGDDEGRTPEDVLASRPGWNLFRDGSPNGESPADISARADRVIARVRLLKGNVALFCHSHFGRVFAARWLGLTAEHAQQFLFDTASLSVLCYEHDSLDEPAIALWNSAACATFAPALSQSERETRSINRRAIERWDNEGGEQDDPAIFSEEAHDSSAMKNAIKRLNRTNSGME
jgi:broad specificity phosphatase PhoE